MTLDGNGTMDKQWWEDEQSNNPNIPNDVSVWEQALQTTSHLQSKVMFLTQSDALELQRQSPQRGRPTNLTHDLLPPR